LEPHNTGFSYNLVSFLSKYCYLKHLSSVVSIDTNSFQASGFNSSITLVDVFINLTGMFINLTGISVILIN